MVQNGHCCLVGNVIDSQSSVPGSNYNPVVQDTVVVAKLKVYEIVGRCKVIVISLGTFSVHCYLPVVHEVLGIYCHQFDSIRDQQVGSKGNEFDV